MKRRWPGPGRFPSELYLKAREQARKLPVRDWAHPERVQASLASAAGNATLTPWEALGPGNIGGRVRGLAIDPTNPNTIYAGAATGGVWKTTDGGQTWVPLTDLLPVLTIGTLAMDPTNPKVLYAGTGENAGEGQDLGVGDGIFKTTDGGVTWKQLGDSSVFGYHVYSIAISPSRPSHLYAGTDLGLIVSRDSGATWNVGISFHQVANGCTSVAARGDQPTDIVFAACGPDFGSAVQIYRNLDAAGSGTWQSVQSDTNNAAWEILAISPSNPATIYGITTSTTNGALGVFRRSTDNGNSWQTMASSNETSSNAGYILSRYPCQSAPGQGYYNMAIAVDPKDPNTVFVGGIVIFRTKDGGTTWDYLPGAHPDQHVFAFAPGYDGQSNQTLYVGNDGGVYLTNTARIAVTQSSSCGLSGDAGWTALNNSFVTTQFYYGTPVPGGWSYLGGTQDNGNIAGADLKGINGWNLLFSGDGGQVLVDPIDPNVRFLSLAQAVDIQKTSDGGVTFVSAQNGISGGTNWAYYFTFDPSNSQTLWYAGQYQVFRSLDAGNSWQAASATITGTEGVSVVAIDPNDSNTAYFGTQSTNRIYKKTAAVTSGPTTSWTPYTIGSDTGYVSSIAFDPNLPNRMYATNSNLFATTHISRSDDRGITWTAVATSSFPQVSVNTLVVDPDQSATLYVGTDIGVFASFDGGNTWTQGSAPFAEAIVYSLVVRKENGIKTLWVFTYGRGAWRLNLSGTPSTCTYSLSSNSISVNSEETTGTLQVTTQAGCTWSAAPGKFATIQSPAIGVGSSKLYYKIPLSFPAQARSDTFYVQNMPVTVNQSSTYTNDHYDSNDLLSSPRAIGGLPYADQMFPSGYTNSASDPVHSCTGSTDGLTAWWTYTAQQTGILPVTVRAVAQHFYGDAGVVVTAYSLSGGTLGREWACLVIPQNKNVPISTTQFSGTPGTIQLPVIAGFQYAIEIATTTSEVPYAEYLEIVDAPQVAVTPATSYVGVGQQRQFAASVTASANTSPGVRWTIAPPQYGQITQTGKYTAPAAVSSATTITITASSFANSSAQGIASVTLLPTGQSDFSLSVTPSPQSVMQGNSIAYTVNTAGNPGPETVTFSVSGLPTNTTYSFDPASVVSGATSTLTILTTSGTSTGTFFPIVTGTGSGGIVVHNSTVSLTVNPPAPPELAIAKSHAGNFRQSQSHAVYTLTVSNNNTAGPTNGTVTVTENLPTGLSLASTSGMSGTGWSCSVNTCTRADSIGTGASYPPITVLVNVAANTASQVTNSVTVSGGGSPSSSATDMTNVTALASVPKYLVGDIYPSTSDVAGSFGSDGINTLDLLAVLRAATNVSGSVPDACSDRYDAMDAYPLDAGSTRGGDGSIDTLDLLAILQRVTNADVNRPSRAARTSCITASVAPQRKADKASGSIELGAATQSSDGWWHTPVYLRATADLDLMGLALSLGYGADALPAGAQTRFVASGRPPNITDQDLPGIVALAWLHGWQAKAGQRLLIGSFDSTIATAPTFFGASANATGDGHAIHLSMQQSQMLRQ